ncbi:MAG TPA: hypothetical protein VFR81_19765 [Longimicrobium sp.]|nr:hypothetical protein [Longimicrobium sp.]
MTSLPRIRAGLFAAAFTIILSTFAAAQDAAPAASRDAGARSEQRANAASARREEGTGRVARSTRTRLEADVIGPQATAYGDVYTLVAALRPQWLSSRSSTAEVRVYRDGTLVGGAGELRYMSLDAVQRVEWLSGMDATTRYGMNHGGGAIFVHTRR